MTTNQSSFQRRHSPFSGVDLLLHRSGWLFLAVLVGFLSLGPLSRSEPLALTPGDILYADSGNAIEGGFIIQVDPNSGADVVVSSGGYLVQPIALALASDGTIIIADTCGCLIRFHPGTGQQTIIVDNSQGTLGVPFSIALDLNGDILVANAQSLLRVSAVTRQIKVLSAGGYFQYPVGVSVSDTGGVFVINRGVRNQIIAVNPKNGVQKVISEGQLLNGPQAIVAGSDCVYVTDVADPSGNFGNGRILRVDLRTGAQTIVSHDGFLIGPVGLTFDENGQLIVADPYTINPSNPGPSNYDGGIIGIDPATGDQTLLAVGHGSYVNPRGVAVVSAFQKARKNSRIK